MKVDKDLIKHVASTARLSLTEEEIDLFLPQLKEIIDAFSVLGEVDTNQVEPSYHPLSIEPRMRKDIIGKCLSNDDALKNSKHKKEGYFKGPKII